MFILTIIIVRVGTNDGTTFRGLAVQVRQTMLGSTTFSNVAPFVGRFVNEPMSGDWKIWNCASVSRL